MMVYYTRKEEALVRLRKRKLHMDISLYAMIALATLMLFTSNLWYYTFVVVSLLVWAVYLTVFHYDTREKLKEYTQCPSYKIDVPVKHVNIEDKMVLSIDGVMWKYTAGDVTDLTVDLCSETAIVPNDSVILKGDVGV